MEVGPRLPLQSPQADLRGQLYGFSPVLGVGLSHLSAQQVSVLQPARSRD